MGIIALSAAICRNRSLERLSIAGNEISQVMAGFNRVFGALNFVQSKSVVPRQNSALHLNDIMGSKGIET